jgi:hypothetical protein
MFYPNERALLSVLILFLFQNISAASTFLGVFPNQRQSMPMSSDGRIRMHPMPFFNAHPLMFGSGHVWHRVQHN